MYFTEPDTPEQRAALELVADAIVRGVMNASPQPTPEYNPGEPKTARSESSTRS